MKGKSSRADPQPHPGTAVSPPPAGGPASDTAVEVRRAKLKAVLGLMANTADRPAGTGIGIGTGGGTGGDRPGSAAASSGLELALSQMGRTLLRLLGGLESAQDRALPRPLEALLVQAHEKYVEGFARPPLGRAGGEEGWGALGEGKEGLERRLQLQRARTAAADEVYALEQSVADYAAAPPMPREGPQPANGPSLSVEMEAIADALEKIRACVGSITELHNNVSLPWWSSPLRTRDMKIGTIRLNYHARRALLWDWRCHNQLLIRATQLNHLTNSNGVELIKLQENLNTFLKLIEWSKMNTATLTKEMIVLQEQLRDANMRRIELQTALIAYSRELNIVPLSSSPGVDPSYKISEENEESDPVREPASNALVAELALLLLKYTWPEELREDVNRVREWLRVIPTVLE